MPKFNIKLQSELLYEAGFNRRLSDMINLVKAISDIRDSVVSVLRARSKITLHFKRRCIPSGCVPKAQQYLDISNLSRLVSRAPQHLKLRTYF